MSRTLPAPKPDPETEKFWAAAAEGRLLLHRCKKCGRVHYYPRIVCPACGAMEPEALQSSGEGEIYSVSVMRRGEDAPYAVAYVTLNEGPSILTNILADDLGALKAGDRVRLAWAETDGGPPVPMFTPAG
ncbi:MAG: Zn-ribbon domain-containing OB-fold protein [Pseudomonadota bacterium]